MSVPENMPPTPMSDEEAAREAARILSESPAGATMLEDIHTADKDGHLDDVQEPDISTQAARHLAQQALDPLEALFSLPSRDKTE